MNKLKILVIFIFLIIVISCIKNKIPKLVYEENLSKSLEDIIEKYKINFMDMKISKDSKYYFLDVTGQIFIFDKNLNLLI